MKTALYYLGTLAIGIIMATIIFAIAFPQRTESQGLQGGANASDCSIVSSSYVTVGAGASSQILAASSRRAYAVIEQPLAATNTVALNFGSAATLTSGIILSAGSASTTDPDRIEVGLNTPFAYTGAVNAITTIGSTTLRVIDCKY